MACNYLVPADPSHGSINKSVYIPNLLTSPPHKELYPFIIIALIYLTFKNHKHLHNIKQKQTTLHHTTSTPNTKFLPRQTQYTYSPQPKMSERRGAGPGRLERVRPTTEELVEHLEESLGISNLEEGPKLVGAVIAQKLPNKGAIKNILKAGWKDYGETKIFLVRDNLLAITVTDEGMANRILDNGPWSVMKCCFAVKRWPPAKAIEEVDMDLVPHWVQIRGIPLNLSHEENMIKLGEKAGAVMEYENPAKVKGFLRVRVEVDTNQPLVAGFWIPRPDGSETWVEYQYERLADFCYICGRIGHCMDACNLKFHQKQMQSMENGQERR